MTMKSFGNGPTTPSVVAVVVKNCNTEIRMHGLNTGSGLSLLL